MTSSILPCNAITRRDVLGLLLILLVAAVLRLGRPDVLHFQYDQAEIATLAQDVASGRAAHLLGQISSAGLPNSPMAHYILVLPFALFKDPKAVTLTIALWNVVGVGLLWLLAHRYIDPRVALVVGLLYAISPAAIEYSRKIWVQNVHTPFILLALLCSLYGFVEGKKWAQAASFPLWLIGLQTHYATWTLLPLAVWPIWLGRRQIDWRAIIIGSVLGLLVVLPFGVGLVQYISQDADAVGDSLSGAPLRLRGKVFYRVLPLLTGGLSIEIERGVIDPGLLWESPLKLLVGLFLGGITLLGLVAVWVRQDWRVWAVPLLLWIVLPVLSFWPNLIGVQTHYFVPLVAGGCLAAGLGAVWLVELTPQPARRIAWGFLSVGLVAMLLIQGVGHFAALEAKSTTDLAGMGIPLRMSLAVRDALASYEDVLIVGGDSTRSGHVVWEALLYHTAESVREVVVADGGIAVLPAGPFAVLTAPLADPFPDGLYESGKAEVFP
ncbi:glycosyltransferase family 39 protein, partial [Chloroflexota bacterium]